MTESGESRKLRDLFIVGMVYVIAYGLGVLSCFYLENTIIRFFVFDITATVVTFVFSLIFRNSSVYDPYWSLTPMVISIWLFVENGAFSVWQILFLTVFNIWSMRLTVNWVTVFTDFSYEDWRYRKFRDENGPFMWFVINFFGIHMVPTLIVFAGMLPLFEIATNPLGAWSVPGAAIILCGVAFEFFADRAIHAFISSDEEKTVCRKGLWKYSRHPNYLGEISVWVGTFVTMIPYALDKWYYAVGMVSVVIMFLIISIPLMEKRQLQRRPDYAEYKKETSMLLILPSKRRD